MAFGFLDHPRIMSHVCASKPYSRGKEVMQPYLAPDPDFPKALRTSRFTYIWEYGCTGPTKSYVALSFFRIPGDFFYTSENRPRISGPIKDASYADEKAEDGGLMRRYFNAKYLYTKHFLVSNSENHVTAGGIVNCFL
ncbi:hypothetical protein POM88_001689 [Heracleum sosnowskyi]|uniref:Uncharacterized protein n=1 Tax=Heracleum sosnowskyi TaxID=360622 RepID=A0AAD8JDH1_9APIA|nr:hypothetical protein POM88_001689 [Heracleum sosnowskyi]